MADCFKVTADDSSVFIYSPRKLNHRSVWMSCFKFWQRPVEFL